MLQQRLYNLEATMAIDPQAGKLPGPERLTDIPALIASYYTDSPSPEEK